MPDLTPLSLDLAKLRERLEAATEGSRGLDALIFRALGGPLPEQFANLKLELTWQPDGSASMAVGGMQVRYEPPAYTTSLDAIMGLIEQQLPGQGWNLLHRAMMDWRTHAERDARRRLPLSACCALLTALQLQGGSER